MYISTLALQNFRNYESRSIDFGRGVNILTGKNGEGKTNMLEAVHILSMGRSFRTLNDAEAIMFGRDFFRIKGLFEKDREDMTVEVGMNGREKSFVVDGVKVRKGADLAGHALTVIFSPDDLRIVKDEPEKRRRFMDHELFQLKPLYYLDVVKYRRIVKNRNLLLKEQTLNERLLDVYDGYLAETGARIMAERARFAEKLAAISAGIQSRITTASGEEQGALEVSYEPNIELDGELDSAQGYGADDIRGTIECELRRRRAKDRETGVTTAGPHKDDLKIASGGVDLRTYGSQGQQRTAALALKLAEVDIIREETGEMPILLLDDVLSELDEDRQRHLPGSFEDCQIVITTADPPGVLMEAFPDARHIEISPRADASAVPPLCHLPDARF
jgi:DNA replication and repair protein RecF